MYDCWVARYPNNDTGELQERLRISASTGVIGWQYSSKATIPGIQQKPIEVYSIKTILNLLLFLQTLPNQQLHKEVIL